MELAELVAQLVSIDSVNPELVRDGAGEEAIAQAVAEWLERAGLEVAVERTACGRPNVIASRQGNREGRSLLLLAHTDTVGTAGMERPFEARVERGRLYGRGAYDMKGGLAAAMAAAAVLDPGELAGTVTVAAVCDEEAGSAGTRALLESGRRFEAAIVTEPTELQAALAHKGFLGFEVETRGRAAHGSRPDLGEDAILAIGPVLSALAALDDQLQQAPFTPCSAPPRCTPR